jgi:hypothetical protein
MNMLTGIKPSAILIALFAFYVAPLLPLVVLTSIPNFFGFEPTRGHSFWQTPLPFIAAWFLAIAPVCSSYFAAKLAGRQPLLHGLLVGMAGSLFIELTVESKVEFFKPALIAVIVLSGLFGGWLWRYRNTNQRQEL